MQIHGISHIHGPHGVNAPHNPRLASSGGDSDSRGRIGDRLEISEAADAALRTAESGEIRHDRVAQIRAEIAAGVYESPEKLDAAVDRLLDELA